MHTRSQMPVQDLTAPFANDELTKHAKHVVQVRSGVEGVMVVLRVEAAAL